MKSIMPTWAARNDSLNSELIKHNTQEGRRLCLQFTRWLERTRCSVCRDVTAPLLPSRPMHPSQKVLADSTSQQAGFLSHLT